MANGQFQIDDDGMIRVKIGRHELDVDPAGEQIALLKAIRPFLGEGDEFPTDPEDVRWIEAVKRHVLDTHGVRIGMDAAVEYWNGINREAERVADFFTRTPESHSGTASNPEPSPPPAAPGTSSISTN